MSIMDIELRDVEVTSLFKISSLKFMAGEKVLIFGPSGRGKTSLLHLIGGLWKPAQGQILLSGLNICAMGDQELSHLRREKVGFIFQKMNLLEHMTCLENLDLVRNDKDQDQKIKLLGSVGLGEKTGQLAGTLSLGEQQRLAIARVLLQNPDVILADEPTSSLDEANAVKVLGLLLDASKNKTLIVVSHDSRLQKHFDRVVNFEEVAR
jgi:ABC-type lipoprotein export system ATPase subunit